MRMVRSTRSSEGLKSEWKRQERVSESSLPNGGPGNNGVFLNVECRPVANHNDPHKDLTRIMFSALRPLSPLVKEVAADRDQAALSCSKGPIKEIRWMLRPVLVPRQPRGPCIVDLMWGRGNNRHIHDIQCTTKPPPAGSTCPGTPPSSRYSGRTLQSISPEGWRTSSSAEGFTQLNNTTLAEYFASLT